MQTLEQLDQVINHIEQDRAEQWSWCDECGKELDAHHWAHGDHVFCSNVCAMEFAHDYDGEDQHHEEEEESE